MYPVSDTTLHKGRRRSILYPVSDTTLNKGRRRNILYPVSDTTLHKSRRRGILYQSVTLLSTQGQENITYWVDVTVGWSVIVTHMRDDGLEWFCLVCGSILTESSGPGL